MEAREIILHSRIGCICEGSLDNAEIALRYSPFSAHALARVYCERRELRGNEGGLHGGDVRESVTSISEEARKLPN